MKDAYYFSHDSNARHDQKVVSMRAAYGGEGYGWYWMILEIMREQEGYCIDTSNKYWLNSIALDLGETKEKIKEFLDDCIDEFDLFQRDGTKILSTSLLRRMEKLDARREQAISAAQARWGKKKEEKPKEEQQEKPKEVSADKVKTRDVLTNDKYWKHFKKQLLEDKRFSALTEKVLENQRYRCVNWLQSKDKRYKDYRAFFKNWISKVVEEQDSMSGSTKTGMVL